jgi:hypothetical protein
MVMLAVAVLLPGKAAAVAAPTRGAPMPVTHQPFPPEKAGGNKAGVTPNWAGYADTGTTFSNVTGEWVVPAVTCPTNALEESSFWVGIDGYKSSTVEQTGTDSDCDKGTKKKPGGPTYYAWWGIYPSAYHSYSDTIEPGDVMSADVSGSGSAFTLTLIDVTRNETMTTQRSAPAVPDYSSAEWIAEANTNSCSGSSCSYLKLADFGSVSFSDCQVDGSSISTGGPTVQPVSMLKGKTPKALPSALSAGGTAFTVTWYHN